MLLFNFVIYVFLSLFLCIFIDNVTYVNPTAVNKYINITGVMYLFTFTFHMRVYDVILSRRNASNCTCEYVLESVWFIGKKICFRTMSRLQCLVRHAGLVRKIFNNLAKFESVMITTLGRGSGCSSICIPPIGITLGNNGRGSSIPINVFTRIILKFFHTSIKLGRSSLKYFLAIASCFVR